MWAPAAKPGSKSPSGQTNSNERIDSASSVTLLTMSSLTSFITNSPIANCLGGQMIWQRVCPARLTASWLGTKQGRLAKTMQRDDWNHRLAARRFSNAINDTQRPPTRASPTPDGIQLTFDLPECELRRANQVASHMGTELQPEASLHC